VHQDGGSPASLRQCDLHCFWDVQSLMALHFPPQLGCLLNAEVGGVLRSGVLLRPSCRPSEGFAQKLGGFEFANLTLATGV
jgi:hypothetical protein